MYVTEFNDIESERPGFLQNSFNNNSVTLNLDERIYAVIWVVAIYLSFQRNRGFNLKSFVAATFFAPFYLLYAIAVPVKPNPARNKRTL